MFEVTGGFAARMKQPLRRTMGGLVVLAIVATFLVALAAPAGAVVPTLIKQIRMHLLSPPGPDAAGVAYMPGADRLWVADSEVEEEGYWQGVNLWQITRTGSAPSYTTVTDTGTTHPTWGGGSTGGSPEPTGLAYIQASNTLLITSDSGQRLFIDRPGADGRFGTADDLVQNLNAGSLYGIADAEDVAWDPSTGHMWLSGGDQGEWFEVDPVNGAFGDGNDISTRFVATGGASDVEGLGFDPNRNTVLVADRPDNAIYEYTRAGALVQIIELENFNDVRLVSDVEVAPSSNNPGGLSYYVSDRGIDNGQDPNENAGGDSNNVTVDNVDGAPTVTLTAPAEGATVSGAAVQLSATASDDVGVTQVEFFDGSTSIGVDSNGGNGWSLTWDTTAVAGGAHSLEARARDTAGNFGSDFNNVTVDNVAPTVEITAPAAGSEVTGNVTVTANAGDNGSVASVQFFDGADSIGTDSSPTGGWSVIWNAAVAPNGPHTLTALATDLGGNATTSAPVEVTVNHPLIVDVPVAEGLDDVEERSTGAVNTTSTDLDMVNDGTAVQRAVGLRFVGINVPQGAAIVDAYVQFQADETTSDATNLLIQGQDVDNAPVFTATNSNVTNRARTSASVAWVPPAWTINQRTAAQQTPDLKTVIQEIVGRPGWTPGNAIVLIVTGTGRRVAEAANSNTFNPVLHVEYGPSNPPPSVTLTAPAEGATVSGASVALTATATDDTSVTQVEFFDGTTSIGTDTNGTDGWSVTWDSTAVADGTHTLTATATDSEGATGSDSNQVTVDNVDAPPSVTLTAPAEGAVVGGANVTLTATANDDGAVTQVEFLDGTTSIGVDTSAAGGWTVNWNTTGAADGPHTITARATDDATQTAEDSNQVTVDNAGPTVAITSPTPGSTVSGTVAVQATATDAGGVASVQFFVGAASIGADSNGADGWSVSWNTTTSANGARDLTAVATDAAGNPTTSAIVQVTVDNPLAIDVSIVGTANDVEERSNGAMNTSSNDMDMMLDGNTVQRAAGLRFTGINVPQGATITNAYIQFKADEADTVATNLVVQAQAHDNAPAFTTQNSNLSSRPRTAASAAWAVPAWTNNAIGPAQRTPDLASVIEEVVDRPGWAPGNALVFVITGSGQRVADATSTGQVPAALHVEYGPADDSPTVTLTAPAEGATVSGPAVSVQATAADDEGVTQVEFFDGATSIGTDTDGADGWSVTWDTTGATEGSHTITATATDTIGQTTSDSHQVTVDNVNDPPSVTLTAPAEGAVVGGATVNLTATATDDGVVTMVQFFDGLTPIGTDTNGANGWSATWDTTGAAEGAHTLTARATDDTLQTGEDANLVTVDNAGPTVSVSSPAAGSTVSGTVNVQATATDSSGVASVEFFVGAASIGTDANGADGWSVAWNTNAVVNGTHDLTARATDVAGNPTTSAVVQVTVDNTAPPAPTTISTTTTPPDYTSYAGPFADANGTLYVFLRSDSSPRVSAFRSDDGGQTWIETDAANRPTTTGVYSVSAVQSGSVIYLAYFSDSADDVFFATFRTSDDATANTWGITNRLVAAYTNTSSESTASIAIQPDGDLIILSSGQDGTYFSGREPIEYHYSQDGGNTWTAKQVFLGTNSDNPAATVVAGSTGTIHGFAKEEGQSRYVHRSLADVTSAPSAAESVSTGRTPTGYNYSHAKAAVSYDDDGVERVVFGFTTGTQGTGPYIPYTTKVDDDGTPDTPDQVTTTGVKSTLAYSHVIAWTLAVDGPQKTVYAVFVNAADNDIYYRTNVDDGGWGTTDTLFAAADADNLTARVYTRAGTVYLGVVWDDAGPEGTTMFAAIPIRSA